MPSAARDVHHHAILAQARFHGGAHRGVDILAHVGEDHVFEGRVGLHGLHLGIERAQGDHRLGAGIGKLALDFRGRIQRIRIDDDRAQLERGIKRDHELGKVGQHDCHPVALAHAEAIEGSGEAVHFVLQLAISQPAANGGGPHVADDQVHGVMVGK